MVSLECELKLVDLFGLESLYNNQHVSKFLQLAVRLELHDETTLYALAAKLSIRVDWGNESEMGDEMQWN